MFKIFKKMSKEPKFKLGDILRHRATNKHNGKKMLVTAIGTLKNADGETIIYQLSGEKDSYVARDDAFFRSILDEQELELHEG